MKNTTIKDCKIIQLPKFQEREKGDISFIENKNHIPFDVKRIFYLYDIPGGESRGAHSHYNCNQFLIAASGCFTVEIDDGKKKYRHVLNKPDFGLFIPCGIWASELDFSSGSICLVLTSDYYKEDDYIRDYDKFLNLKLDVTNS